MSALEPIAVDKPVRHPHAESSGTMAMPQRQPATLILSRHDIATLMTPAAYLDAVETGFRAGAAGKAHAPPPMSLEGNGGAFHAKGARIELDRNLVALKFNGNFPGNPQANHLPTIQGAIRVEPIHRRPRPTWRPWT